MSEDLAHDAHLRAALRHAPDHALSPPSGLTQSILAASRQAHRPTEATPAPSPMRLHTTSAPSLRAWLRRMVSPRWAGAWAVAGVAALGFGLWIDFGPSPEAERTVVAAIESVPAAAPAVAMPPPTDDGPARAVAKAEGPRAAEAAKEARRAAHGERPRASADAAPRREVAAAQSRESDGAPVTAAPAVATAPRAAVAEREPRPSDEGGGAAPPKAAARPAAPPAAAIAGVGEGRAAADAGSALALRRGPQTEAPLDASPTQTLWRRARDESATGAAHWAWSAPGRPTITPVDGDALAWLQRVTLAAQGRWGDASGRAEPQATEVRWWRDGWPVATLRIEPDGVRWVEPGRTRFAPLDAATVQRLRGP